MILVFVNRLGRWIWVGNCLHKTAVATGVVSLVASLLWRDRPVIAAPACALSLFCTGLYTVSWNYDPCCQYQVCPSPLHAAVLPRNPNPFLSIGGEQRHRAGEATVDRRLLACDLGLLAQLQNQIFAPWRHLPFGCAVRLADLAILQVDNANLSSPIWKCNGMGHASTEA